MEQEKAIRADVLAASRAQHAAEPQPAVKKTVSSPRAAEQTPDKKKQSRFAALVGSLGFGNTPTTEKEVPPTPSSGRRDRRAPHIARPLNGSGRTPPVHWRALCLLTKRRRARPPQGRRPVLVCYRCEGLCSGTCTAAAQVSPSSSTADGRDAWLSKVRAARASLSLPRSRGRTARTGANGGDFGYRTAMAFIVETRFSEGYVLRLRSELTGGYVNVGGLFQRYCLCASAPTAAEATSFEFVARGRGR